MDDSGNARKVQYWLALATIGLSSPGWAGSWSVTVGTSPAFFAPQVQSDLVTTFFGRGADADQLRFSDDLYEGVIFPSTGATVSLTYRHDVAAHWYVEGELGLGQLRLEALEGIGIFTDPAQAHLRYALAGLQVGREWTVMDGRYAALDADIQFGMVAAHVESRLWSDLLDVRTQSRVAVGKASVGLALTPSFPGGTLSLQGRLTHYQNGITDAAVSLRYRF